MKNLPKWTKIAAIAGVAVLAVGGSIALLSGGGGSGSPEGKNGADGRAQQVSFTDATKDMSTSTSAKPDFVPAPDRVINDIASTTIKQDADSVSTTITFADLTKEKKDAFMVNLTMTTDTKLVRQANVSLIPEVGEDPMASLDSFPTWADDSELGSPTMASILNGCSAPESSVDLAKKSLTVKIQRACLANPDWVQFQIVLSTMTTKPFYDDAFNKEPFTLGDQLENPVPAPSLSALGKYSEKVYRPASAAAADKKAAETSLPNPFKGEAKKVATAIEDRAKAKKTTPAKALEAVLKDTELFGAIAHGAADNKFYLYQSGWCIQGEAPKEAGGTVSLDGPNPGQVVVSTDGTGSCLFDK